MASVLDETYVPEEPVRLPKPKRMVRVILKNERWFDLPVPDDFSLITFVVSVRGVGHILNEALYVSVEDIRAIFVYAEQNPEGPGVVLPFNKLEPKP